MAREVKMPYDFVTGEPINIEKLKAFEALVRADEREQIIATQPAPVQEPAPGYCQQCKQYSIEEPLPAAPAVPDALTIADKESPDYHEGWNDCRSLMLEMRKP
jgi:hypothetical protein